MVTITDQPELEYGLPSFEDFLVRRMGTRQSAARDLEAVRARKHADAQRLRDSYAQQIEQLATAKLGFADRGRLRIELELQKRKDLSAVNGAHDVEIAEIRRRYGLERSPRVQRADDFRDYMHAAKVHREDVELAERNGLPNPGFDPVIELLPKARRRRDNGWMIYETPELHGLAGQRELLRCNNREIVVRGADDDRVRAALLVASERYAPPLRLAGSDKFMSRARTIAADLGIALSDAAEQRTDSTPETTTANEQAEQRDQTRDTEAASQDDSTPEIVVAQTKSDPDLDFSINDEVLREYAKGFGKSFVVPANSDKIVGQALGWFGTDLWDHSGALVVGCNERTAVVVPIPDLTRPSLEMGNMLELTRGDDGRYAIRNLDREAKAAETLSAEADELEDEQSPETLSESPELATTRVGGRGGR